MMSTAERNTLPGAPTSASSSSSAGSSSSSAAATKKSISFNCNDTSYLATSSETTEVREEYFDEVELQKEFLNAGAYNYADFKRHQRDKLLSSLARTDNKNKLSSISAAEERERMIAALGHDSSGCFSIEMGELITSEFVMMKYKQASYNSRLDDDNNDGGKGLATVNTNDNSRTEDGSWDVSGTFDYYHDDEQQQPAAAETAKEKSSPRAHVAAAAASKAKKRPSIKKDMRPRLQPVTETSERSLEPFSSSTRTFNDVDDDRRNPSFRAVVGGGAEIRRTSESSFDPLTLAAAAVAADIVADASYSSSTIPEDSMTTLFPSEIRTLPPHAASGAAITEDSLTTFYPENIGRVPPGRSNASVAVTEEDSVSTDPPRPGNSSIPAPGRGEKKSAPPASGIAEEDSMTTFFPENIAMGEKNDDDGTTTAKDDGAAPQQQQQQQIAEDSLTNFYPEGIHHRPCRPPAEKDLEAPSSSIIAEDSTSTLGFESKLIHLLVPQSVPEDSMTTLGFDSNHSGGCGALAFSNHTLSNSTLESSSSNLMLMTKVRGGNLPPSMQDSMSTVDVGRFQGVMKELNIKNGEETTANQSGRGDKVDLRNVMRDLDIKNGEETTANPSKREEKVNLSGVVKDFNIKSTEETTMNPLGREEKIDLRDIMKGLEIKNNGETMSNPSIRGVKGNPSTAKYHANGAGNTGGKILDRQVNCTNAPANNEDHNKKKNKGSFRVSERFSADGGLLAQDARKKKVSTAVASEGRKDRDAKKERSFVAASAEGLDNRDAKKESSFVTASAGGAKNREVKKERSFVATSAGGVKNWDARKKHASFPKSRRRCTVEGDGLSLQHLKQNSKGAADKSLLRSESSQSIERAHGRRRGGTNAKEKSPTRANEEFRGSKLTGMPSHTLEGRLLQAKSVANRPLSRSESASSHLKSAKHQTGSTSTTNEEFPRSNLPGWCARSRFLDSPNTKTGRAPEQHQKFYEKRVSSILYGGMD